jgi:hypothetical protein
MTTLTDQLLDVVEGASFIDADREFLAAMHSLHALAVSRLPANEREEALLAVECGALRRAADMFPRTPYPRANGYGGPA